MSRQVPVPATAFARLVKTLPEKLCSGSVCVTHTGAATVLVLGEVVSGRGAVAFRRAKRQPEWSAATKTSERLRPYAAAESLGTLAGEGRTLRTAALTGKEPLDAGILNGICPHC